MAYNWLYIVDDMVINILVGQSMHSQMDTVEAIMQNLSFLFDNVNKLWF